MTNIEFKKSLVDALKSHSLTKGRDYHTVNELLYVLEHDLRFYGKDFNISISTLKNHWWSIPCLDAFVDVKTRGVWFNDDMVEFEVDEFEEDGKIMKFNCIIVYEREENNEGTK